jgi:hypothetical protein
MERWENAPLLFLISSQYEHLNVPIDCHFILRHFISYRDYVDLKILRSHLDMWNNVGVECLEVLYYTSLGLHEMTKAK